MSYFSESFQNSGNMTWQVGVEIFNWQKVAYNQNGEKYILLESARMKVKIFFVLFCFLLPTVLVSLYSFGNLLQS